MANRVTSLLVEVVVRTTSEKARVTSELAEVVVAPTSQKARVTSELAEVVVAPTSQKARVTSELVNVLVAPTSQKVRVTSILVNVVISKELKGAFILEAVKKKTATPTFALDAVIGIPPKFGSFLLDAMKRKPRTGSFTLDATVAFYSRINRSYAFNAIVKGTPTSSFELRAWIKTTGGVGVTGEPGVHIKVGGVDITNDVIFRDATFTMLVNGAVGSFKFRVRDVGHNHLFVSGAEVTLDIEGVRKFGGYLMKPGRVFAFPVDDTTVPSSVGRFWVLEGVDYNILFAKRIVYDKADPANINLRSWPAGSRDDDIIRYVFNNYTDLIGDGAVTDGVTHIGSPNPDYRGVVGSGSLKFGDAMREINRLLSGVFYFDPYKVLHFVDVDTADAVHQFSDHPVGTLEVGYRDFTHVENGAGLINDAMVWGAGTGSATIAYRRVIDTASQTAHGLWQYGEFTASLYKPQSVQKRADSLVNGTAQSRRGGKDDQVSWTLTTFDTSFSVGEKVQTESEVWGVSDVVPIRRMTITFPTPRKPQLSLVLSHEIDEPWNLYEFFFPNLGPIKDIISIQIPPFDVLAAHWYFGTFTYISDGGGSAEGPDVPDFANTIFSDNTTLPTFLDGTQYTWAMGLIVSHGACGDHDTGHELGLVSAGGTWKSPHVVDNPLAGFNLLGFAGTFTGHSGNFAAYAASRTGGGCHIGKTVNVTYFFDPAGWNIGTPIPGQKVINDFLAVGNGTQTVFFTTFPYEPGTLVVQVEGANAAVTETNPATGQFTLTVAPTAGQQIIAFYTAAGGLTDAFNRGPVREDIPGTGSTTVTLSISYVPGSTKVFLDGYFQRPTHEYTESNPDAAQLTFTIAPTVGQTVSVFYDANGPSS